MLNPSFKQVGLFGGTFDPVHNGHLKAALEIKDRLTLDHIYFIPAYLSPFKTALGTASSHHRLEMLKQALKEYPDFSVSEFELNKKEISYTIDTLRHYHKLLPEDAKLYFILGSDAFLGISKWKNVDEIFASCHLIVVSRPGYYLRPLNEIIRDSKLIKEFVMIKKGEQYKHFTGHYTYLFQLPSVDISSTQLRSKISNEEPYSSFVSPAVAEYIKAHALYKPNQSNAKN